MSRKFYVHPTADVSPQAIIGEGSRIWHHCQIRERAEIGRNCVLSKGVYIDFEVRVGDNCKIQNGISIYHGVTLEDGVFCGPHCVFTNDKMPRAINPDGSLKGADDWTLSLQPNGQYSPNRLCQAGCVSDVQYDEFDNNLFK
jgi:UDP-3-O-[3-hydroxymyristoyl] glucosamine N-acyltransferase